MECYLTEVLYIKCYGGSDDVLLETFINDIAQY